MRKRTERQPKPSGTGNPQYLYSVDSEYPVFVEEPGELEIYSVVKVTPSYFFIQQPQSRKPYRLARTAGPRKGEPVAECGDFERLYASEQEAWEDYARTLRSRVKSVEENIRRLRRYIRDAEAR